MLISILILISAEHVYKILKNGVFFDQGVNDFKGVAMFFDLIHSYTRSDSKIGA